MLQLQIMIEGLAISNNCPYSLGELWDMSLKRLQRHKDIIDFKDALDIAAKIDANTTNN